MKHYRIIQTGEGFTIQSRFLWIFWLDCAEPAFKSSDGYISDDESKYFIYDSYNDALGAIKRLEHMYYEYKGHTIQYGYLYDRKYFVDLNSKYTNYKGDKVYSRYSENLTDIKTDIDKEIKEKERNEEKKKIINIWNINDVND